MEVTVSPKYQIVIPMDVRREVGLTPGDRMQVFLYGDRIELVRVRPVQELRGFVRGIDTNVDRETDRA
ncbi:MAG: AbrB/MazE/SpoVT family DNA-binding domain-containing protein [Deltaproteobacteria bacterium]|nr:AbrB/MazE/SpoVT family DNA-binding domain-containing protein [Deltaproteobacteria bacterium]